MLTTGSSNVAMTLDQMAAASHVDRSPRPDDRWWRPVGITPEGLAVNEKTAAGLAEIETRVMDTGPTPDGQARVAALARISGTRFVRW